MLGVMGFEESSNALLDAGPSSIQQFREEFPVDGAAHLPESCRGRRRLSRRASNAMKELTEQACQFGSLHYTEWMKCYSDLRQSPQPA